MPAEGTGNAALVSNEEQAAEQPMQLEEHLRGHSQELQRQAEASGGN